MFDRQRFKSIRRRHKNFAVSKILHGILFVMHGERKSRLRHLFAVAIDAIKVGSCLILHGVVSTLLLRLDALVNCKLTLMLNNLEKVLTLAWRDDGLETARIDVPLGIVCDLVG